MRQFHFPSTRDNHGQIAVVILLIMAILLVIGISLANRTSQEIAISTQTQDTTRVFNAAEAGIEAALQEDFTGGALANNPAFDGIDVDVSVVDPEEDITETIWEPGQTATYELTSSTPSVTWTGPGNCADHASLIITAYYDDGGTIKAAHQAVKPCSTNSDGTSFTVANATPQAGSARSATHNVSIIPSGTTALLLRIKPLYHSTTLEVTDAESNVVRIRSEAQSTLGGNEFRAIEVERTLPAPPPIFDYALYSGADLVK